MAYKRRYSDLQSVGKFDSSAVLNLPHRIQRVLPLWASIFQFLRWTDDYHLVCKVWQMKFFCTHIETYLLNAPKLRDFSNLVELKLEERSWSDKALLLDMTVRNAISNLSQLQSLEIGNVEKLDLSKLHKCKSLTITLSQFIILPPNLEVLDMSGVIGTGVTLFAADLPHLKNLTLHFTDIKEKDLHHLSSYSNLTKLHWLGNVNCGGHEDESWIFDLAKCKKLEELEIGSQGLAKLDLPKSLRYLTVQIIDQLTAKDLFLFPFRNHSLHFLHITDWSVEYSLQEIPYCFPSLAVKQIEESNFKEEE